MKHSGRWIAAIAVLVLAAVGAPPAAAAAAGPHENPATAAVIYSNLSLLQYYVDIQDYVLGLDPDTVAARLQKMNFANVPDNLRPMIDDAGPHQVDLAGAAQAIDADLGQMERLVSQYRLSEATALADGVRVSLATGYAAVSSAEDDFRLMSATLGLRSGSPAYTRYANLLQKIADERALLDRDAARLTAALASVQRVTILGVAPTDLAFTIAPNRAFVGDSVSFSGALTTRGQPLEAQDVIILLNGQPYVTAPTGPAGTFRGEFRVPYNYVDRMTVEALYQPAGDMVGRYLGSRSAALRLDVLFYTASIDLNVPEVAYPGIDLAVTGSIRYDNNPDPEARTIEVYLDDELVKPATATREISLALAMPPNIETGHHTLTLVAPAQGRYSPAMATGQFTVTRVAPLATLIAPTTPILPFAQMGPLATLAVPGIFLYPGVMDVQGRITSDTGPVEGANLIIHTAGSSTTAVTAADGTFQARLSRGMGLTFLGSQVLYVEISPTQPWYSKGTAETSIFVINWAFTVIILLCMAVLALLLRRRLQRFGRTAARELVAVPETGGPALALPEPVAVARQEPAAAAELLPKQSPRQIILIWYRRIVALVQRILQVTFGVAETPREFLGRVAPHLGPARSFFTDLTVRAERTLYSDRGPSAAEAEDAARVSREIEGRLGKSA